MTVGGIKGNFNVFLHPRIEPFDDDVDFPPGIVSLFPCPYSDQHTPVCRSATVFLARSRK